MDTNADTMPQWNGPDEYDIHAESCERCKAHEKSLMGIKSDMYLGRCMEGWKLYTN